MDNPTSILRLGRSRELFFLISQIRPATVFFFEKEINLWIHLNSFASLGLMSIPGLRQFS